MDEMGRINMRLKVFFATMLASGCLILGSVQPAAATSSIQPGNCNNNYDADPVVYTLVVRAPKIWSNTGANQSVRYRSVLDKWNGNAWAWKATGVWRSGIAGPNTAWQDASRAWSLNSYGAGYYTVRIQVQYLRNGAWGGTETRRVNTYYLMWKSMGVWELQGTVNYCRAY